MCVKQLSIFIENSPGRLAEITRMLGEHHIDLISLSLADTSAFGMLRGLVKNCKEAEEIIREAGFAVTTTDVLCVCLPDAPGSLAHVLLKLSEAGVSIEYMYSFLRNAGQAAYIVFRTNQMEQAKQVLWDEKVPILSQDDLCTL